MCFQGDLGLVFEVHFEGGVRIRMKKKRLKHRRTVVAVTTFRKLTVRNPPCNNFVFFRLLNTSSGRESTLFRAPRISHTSKDN